MPDPSLRHEPERRQREVLEKLFETTDLTIFEMFRNFPVFTPRYNLARFLTHYEIFKRIVSLPGVIVDLGIFQGASTFTWAKLCEIFCPTDVRKFVYAFDSFSGFPEIAGENGPEDEQQDRRAGGYFGGEGIESDLHQAQLAMNCDRHLRHIDRIRFVKGDVVKTIPEFVKEHGNGLRIALLNLDLDLYEPTSTALVHFAPLMVRGGIIVLDEYAVEEFGGESKAVDEYFQERFGRKAAVIKFPWHSSPSGFIEVDW